MAEFLTTQGTSFYLEQIILKAKEKLILISPYLSISKTFLERLKDADQRGVQITIVYGKKELRKDEELKLLSLRNLSIYFFENLHAKCYLNEQQVIITSMNMYEFSEKNNREMGVLINAKEDLQMFRDAMAEVTSIMSSSKHSPQADSLLDNYPNVENEYSSHVSENHGTCIRCYDSIEFDLDKPMCYPCYISWDRFQNWDYPENHCHLCGKPTRTSMDKPLCSSCFNDLQ